MLQFLVAETFSLRFMILVANPGIQYWKFTISTKIIFSGSGVLCQFQVGYNFVSMYNLAFHELKRLPFGIELGTKHSTGSNCSGVFFLTGSLRTDCCYQLILKYSFTS